LAAADELAVTMRFGGRRLAAANARAGSNWRKSGPPTQPQAATCVSLLMYASMHVAAASARLKRHATS